MLVDGEKDDAAFPVSIADVAAPVLVEENLDVDASWVPDSSFEVEDGLVSGIVASTSCRRATAFGPTSAVHAQSITNAQGHIRAVGMRMLW